MDVKSAFLNCYINEEVNVVQPFNFENHKYHNHVFKLKRVLYDLKQTSRAWYERLNKILLDQEYSRGKTDTTLSLNVKKNRYYSFKFISMTLYLVLLKSKSFQYIVKLKYGQLKYLNYYFFLRDE